MGHAERPAEAEIQSILRTAASPWREFVEWLAEKHDVRDAEWKSVSANYGCSLRLKLKKRTIAYLSP